MRKETSRFVMKLGVQGEGLNFQVSNEFAGVVSVSSQGQREEKPGDS